MDFEALTLVVRSVGYLRACLLACRSARCCEGETNKLKRSKGVLSCLSCRSSSKKERERKKPPDPPQSVIGSHGDKNSRENKTKKKE